MTPAETIKGDEVDEVMEAELESRNTGLGALVKKQFMKGLWRIQQIQSLIMILFWALNLSLLIHPYVEWRLIDWGITNLYARLLTLGSIIVVFILLMGLVYDKRFRFWREQSVVVQERNPYAQWKMTNFQLIQACTVYLPLAEKYGREEDVKVLRLLIHKTLRQPNTRRLLAQSFRMMQKRLEREDGSTPSVSDGSYPLYDIVKEFDPSELHGPGKDGSD